MTHAEIEQFKTQIQACCDPEKMEQIIFQLSEALLESIRAIESIDFGVPGEIPHVMGTNHGRAVYAVRAAASIATNQSEIRDLLNKIGVRA